LLFEGRGGVKVFEDPEAFPRAWAVNRVEPVADMSAMQRIVEERHQDLRTTAYFPVAPPVAKCDKAGDVRVVAHSEDRLVLDADLPCDGLVVVSSTLVPGWRATVDGREASLMEANLLMPAVAVPSGRHRIELVYRPRSVAIGALLTALGLLGAAVVSRLRWT
jgi:uncharacterized membrane protein YfhO